MNRHPVDNIPYQDAYQVFDLIIVATIYNRFIAILVQQDDANKLRYLADALELAYKYNQTQAERSIDHGGRCLASVEQHRHVQGRIETLSHCKVVHEGRTWGSWLFSALRTWLASTQNGPSRYASSLAFAL